MNKIESSLRNVFIITALLSLITGTILFSCTSTKQEDTVQKPVEQKVVLPIDEEYVRSTKEVQDVTFEEFTSDKKTILKKIEELSKIMADKNYQEWLNYIDEESKRYWSSPFNLKKAAQRHPIKGIRLRNLEDYFIWVFIPARKNHQVEEIRYMAKDNVKAVQVKDEMDVVYYNFQKDGNNEWMVSMPPLEN